MACPESAIVHACDFPQFLVNQVPAFDERIMEDIRPNDAAWISRISRGSVPTGTPVEITQDRYRSVWPDTTRKWSRVQPADNGCQHNPCDPVENIIGWGADRLTYYAEEQTWATPLFCYNQDMHITHAKEHISQIISKILKPATLAIQSSFIRKRVLQWADRKWQANANMTPFTFQWSGAGADDEIYFDTSANPNQTFLLQPQHLMRLYEPLMREGYNGIAAFDGSPGDVELVTDMSTIWTMEKLAGLNTSSGVIPNFPATNFRFEQFSAASNFWKYGFSGRIGNYLMRSDNLNLRFNFVVDLGAGAHGGNGNRYRYQVVLPYKNEPTTGAGGAAGIGQNVNTDFDKAPFTLTYITHPMGMQLRVMDASQLHPDMPQGPREFAGRWQWQQDNMVDAAGNPVANPWRNKGRFAAWYKFYIRPLHTEWMEVAFHKRETPCIPETDTCLADPGYPPQVYSSAAPTCDTITNE